MLSAGKLKTPVVKPKDLSGMIKKRRTYRLGSIISNDAVGLINVKAHHLSLCNGTLARSAHKVYNAERLVVRPVRISVRHQCKDGKC